MPHNLWPLHVSLMTALYLNESHSCTYIITTFLLLYTSELPSVLWRCWLGGRKGIRPVKKLSGGVLAWLCLGRYAGLHMVQLMPLLPTVSCFSKIQIGFTFLVPAHLGSPGQRAVKRVLFCCSVIYFFNYI